MKIRSMLPKDEQPVIIAMTASAMEEDRKRYLEVMDDFLAKVRAFKFESLATNRCFMLTRRNA